MTMIHIIQDANGNIWAATTDFDKAQEKKQELEGIFDAPLRLLTMTDLKDL